MHSEILQFDLATPILLSFCSFFKFQQMSLRSYIRGQFVPECNYAATSVGRAQNDEMRVYR